MSRVLFLTPQLPYPPHQGAAIRNLNLIKLAAQRHEVAVCSFVRSPAEAAGAEVLKAWATEVRTVPAPRRGLGRRALSTAFSLTPDMGYRLRSAAFGRLMDEVPADLVQAEGIEMAQYLGWSEPGSPANGVGKRRVLDCHNAEWLLQRRTFEVDFRRGKMIGAAYSALQWLKLRRYERQACRLAGAVVAVSEEDRAALHRLDPRLPVEIIPNGVDAAFFAPPAEPAQADRVLFTGTLDFRPNVDAVLWLAREVWPLVRRALPEANLTVAGRAPVPPIRRLHGHDGIEVWANPPDIRPRFATSAVYVVPVRSGGGSRYKLLQAMSMSLGIVSTTLGAEGIAAVDGQHLRLADDPPSFARAVVELARDASMRRRLGEAARQVVLDRYDWPVLGPRLWALYDRVLKGSCESVKADVTGGC
ncbi:MAG: glycosyltransferase family 4 protein [Chloroflexota bacterium]